MLAVAGTVLAVAGTVLVLTTPIAAARDDAPSMIALGTGGAASFLVGLPMWIAGQRRAARRKRAHAYLTPNGVAF